MTQSKLVKVEWENGDVTIEEVVAENEAMYKFGKRNHSNYWAPKTFCTPIDPVAEVPEIKIGQIFTVEGKKYTIVNPMTSTQSGDANEHGHLVITLINI
jgi:hypothetical protein